LGNVKARIQELTDLIDDALERKAKAKADKLTELAELEKFEGEFSSTVRRIQLLATETEEIAERFTKKDAELKATLEAIDAIEAAREKLEDAESIQDEKITELEEKIRDIKREMGRNANKLRETGQKKVGIAKDTERMKEKADALEQREEILVNNVEKALETLEELESREGDSADREEENKLKIEFLVGQVQEVEIRGDAAVRQCGVLERTNLELINELGQWKSRCKNLDDEMVAMDNVKKIEAELEAELNIDYELKCD